MAGTTTDGYPYAQGSDKGYTIDDTSLALANKLQAMFEADNSRPAAGQKGRRHYNTDTGDLSLDIGSGWIHQSSAVARSWSVGAYSAIPSTLALGTAGTNTGPSGVLTATSTSVVVGTNGAGVYRISARASGAADGSPFTVRLALGRAGNTYYLEIASSNTFYGVGAYGSDSRHRAMLGAELALSVADTISVVANYGTTATVNLEEIRIERVRP